MKKGQANSEYKTLLPSAKNRKCGKKEKFERISTRYLLAVLRAWECRNHLTPERFNS